MFNSLDEIQQEVIRRLKAQGCQAISVDETCQYKTATGMKCAVGVLIPDELYSVEMEGYGIHSLFSKFPSLNDLFHPEILESAINLLGSLQRIHDDAKTFETMIHHMENL